MKDNQKKLIEKNYSKNEPTVKTEEKSLILLEFDSKKNVDQTISNPEKYVTWYQYRSKNIDKYLQLCPHCKKPTLSAFDRSVIDSAIDYINGKRILKTFPRSEGKFSVGVFLMMAFAIIFLFIFNQI